jgi:hypothetical protein
MFRIFLFPILRLSPPIQRLKRALPSASFVKKFILIPWLGLVQFIVSVLSLPAYFFVGRKAYAKITRKTASSVSQYHFRRIVVVTLLFLIALWAGLRFCVDNFFLYENSARHSVLSLQNFSSTLTINYDPVSIGRVEAPAGKDILAVSGEAPPHQTILVVFDQNPSLMGITSTDSLKHWEIVLDARELPAVSEKHTVSAFLVSDDTVLIPANPSSVPFSVRDDFQNVFWQQTSALPVFVITLTALFALAIIMFRLRIFSSLKKA